MTIARLLEVAEALIEVAGDDAIGSVTLTVNPVPRFPLTTIEVCVYRDREADVAGALGLSRVAGAWTGEWNGERIRVRRAARTAPGARAG